MVTSRSELQLVVLGFHCLRPCQFPHSFIATSSFSCLYMNVCSCPLLSPYFPPLVITLHPRVLNLDQGKILTVGFRRSPRKIPTVRIVEIPASLFVKRRKTLSTASTTILVRHRQWEMQDFPAFIIMRSETARERPLRRNFLQLGMLFYVDNFCD